MNDLHLAHDPNGGVTLRRLNAPANSLSINPDELQWLAVTLAHFAACAGAKLRVTIDVSDAKHDAKPSCDRLPKTCSACGSSVERERKPWHGQVIHKTLTPAEVEP